MKSMVKFGVFGLVLVMVGSFAAQMAFAAVTLYTNPMSECPTGWELGSHLHFLQLRQDG